MTIHSTGHVVWEAIESRWGPIDADRRALLNMQLLADDSRRLLTRADQIERWGQGERDDIAAAHAAGHTLAEYYASRQSNNESDW
ncbi:hypothetical protein [Actinoplanes sp. DH11]|uniref:hypothetical protein n=1 Tax=Actinoplanes sp. DH11 TaxID=2857011 RepID=UPI001E5D4205|nr:hypothetical protein [Actinoplanes sp. DH11]